VTLYGENREVDRYFVSTFPAFRYSGYDLASNSSNNREPVSAPRATVLLRASMAEAIAERMSENLARVTLV
jgi:hypothetical protein